VIEIPGSLLLLAPDRYSRMLAAVRHCPLAKFMS